MIVERVLESKKAKIQQWPVNANRASSLGHECTRFLVFERTRWKEKTLHDARVQMIFDIGNVLEQMVSQDLREAGFAVIEQQRGFQWSKYQITGTIDCKLPFSREFLIAICESAGREFLKGPQHVLAADLSDEPVVTHHRVAAKSGFHEQFGEIDDTHVGLDGLNVFRHEVGHRPARFAVVRGL